MTTLLLVLQFDVGGPLFVIVKDLAAAIEVAKSAQAEFEALKVQNKAFSKGHVDDSVASLVTLDGGVAKMLANRQHLQTAYEEHMETANKAEVDFDYFTKVLDMVQKIIIGNDGDTVSEWDLKQALRDEDQGRYIAWYTTKLTLVKALQFDLEIKHEMRKKEIEFRDSLVDRQLAADTYMRVVEGSTSDLHRKVRTNVISRITCTVSIQL
jgi:hypothetical protein